MADHFCERLECAASISDIFEVVKEATWDRLNTGRAGLTCGLLAIPGENRQFVGAFYPVGSNIIVVNKIPIMRILREDRSLFRAYTFHVLLHEYLHSLGYLDEANVRTLTVDITESVFGKDHVASRIARHPEKFLPELAYAHGEMDEEGGFSGLEMVKDFDRSSINYIH